MAAKTNLDGAQSPDTSQPRTRHLEGAEVANTNQTSSRHLEGAEAILTPTIFAGMAALRKERIAKAYRPVSLDEKIRASRTRVEARLLHKAKIAGVPAPVVLAVGPYSITMSKLDGQTLHSLDEKKIPASVWAQVGCYLARLHVAHVVHGDFTPANLMLDAKNKRADGSAALCVIDFGLGSISHDDEDCAVDVLTMQKALPAAAAKAFLEGYGKEGKTTGRRVLALAKKVESRARYQDRGAG